MSFNLDLTDVKESSSFTIPAGTYTVIVDDVEVKDTKSGTGSYINAKYRILGGQYDGKWIFNMFNIKNPNEKAVEIGLGQLKSFMKCSGLKDFKLTNVLDLVGLRCDAVIKVKTDDFGEKNVISFFKPSTTQAASAAPVTQIKKNSAVPF